MSTTQYCFLSAVYSTQRERERKKSDCFLIIIAPCHSLVWVTLITFKILSVFEGKRKLYFFTLW